MHQKLANLLVCEAVIPSSVSSLKFGEFHSSQSLQWAFASSSADGGRSSSASCVAGHIPVPAGDGVTGGRRGCVSRVAPSAPARWVRLRGRGCGASGRHRISSSHVSVVYELGQ